MRKEGWSDENDEGYDGWKARCVGWKKKTQLKWLVILYFYRYYYELQRIAQ